MSFQPTYGRVLVRVDPTEDKIGRIHVPDMAQGLPRSGTVEAVGPGAIMSDGTVHPVPFRPEQRVFWPDGAGYGVPVGSGIHQDAQYLLLECFDVLGTLG